MILIQFMGWVKYMTHCEVGFSFSLCVYVCKIVSKAQVDWGFFYGFECKSTLRHGKFMARHNFMKIINFNWVALGKLSIKGEMEAEFMSVD